MVSRLRQRLVAIEQPIFAAHDVSMWGYVVLTALGETPMRTQAALARVIGADKTRIIPVLDDLHDHGLISREPDPADRRVRLLSLTPAGRSVLAKVQRRIRHEEERLLNGFSVADRSAFLHVLQALQEAD